MRFKDKKAVVVGGAEKSIGQAIARGLAAEGAQVCIWDVNVESAQVTANAITQAGGKAKVMKVNVLDYNDVKAAVDATVKEFGGIDYMVDTVGGGVFKPLAAFTPELFKQQLDFNGVSAFNCAHTVLGHFTEKKEGKILFFTSTTGGDMGLSGYGAGKAVVESLVKSLVTETAQTRICVNAIMPGVVFTPLTVGAFQGLGRDPKQMEEAMKASNPRGLSSPEAVASVALFLLSEQADRITGNVVKLC